MRPTISNVALATTVAACFAALALVGQQTHPQPPPDSLPPAKPAPPTAAILVPDRVFHIAARVPAIPWPPRLLATHGEWWFLEAHIGTATLHRCDLATGESFPALPGVVLGSPGISRDGSLMALHRAITPDAVVFEVWQTDPRKLVRQWPDRDASGICAAISPDNALCVVADRTGYSVRRIADGSLVATLATPVFPGPANDIEFSADGKNILTHSNGLIQLWSAETWALKMVANDPRTLADSPATPNQAEAAREADLPGIAAVRFSAGGREIVAVCSDRYSRKWSLIDGRISREAPILLAPGDAIADVAISPNARIGALITTLGTLRAWEIGRPEAPILATTVGTAGTLVEFADDNRHLAIVADQQLIAVRLPDRNLPIAANQAVRQPIDILAPGPFAVTIDSQTAVTVRLESADGTPLGSGEITAISPRIDFRADRGTIFAIVSSAIDTAITVHLSRLESPIRDLATEPPTDARPPISGLAVVPDGKFLAATTTQSVTVWKLDGAKIAAPRITPLAIPTALAVAPDGRSLAVASSLQELARWEFVEPVPSRRLDLPARIHKLAFAGDADVFALARAKLFRVHRDTWELAGELPLPTADARDFAISPDADFAVIVGEQKLILVRISAVDFVIERIENLATSGPALTLAIVDAGNAVFVGGDGFGKLFEWRDAASKTATTVRDFGPIGLRIDRAVASADGETLLLGYSLGERPGDEFRTVARFRVADGARLPLHSRACFTRISAMAIPADDRGFFAGTNDGALQFWPYPPVRAK